MTRLLKGFSDGDKFAIVHEWGVPVAIHYRDLGDKVGSVYPRARWSDVTIHNVPLETTFEYQDQIYMIEDKIHESIHIGDDLDSMVINSRDKFGYSLSSVESFDKAKMYDGDRLFTYRKRQGLKKRSKKYPTKPKKIYNRMNKEVEHEQYIYFRMEIHDPKYEGEPDGCENDLDRGICSFTGRLW